MTIYFQKLFLFLFFFPLSLSHLPIHFTSRLFSLAFTVLNTFLFCLPSTAVSAHSSFFSLFLSFAFTLSVLSKRFCFIGQFVFFLVHCAQRAPKERLENIIYTYSCHWPRQPVTQLGHLYIKLADLTVAVPRSLPLVGGCARYTIKILSLWWINQRLQ